MQEVNLFEIFLSPLDKTDIKYFVTGSVAAMLYGEPRLTHDIDIVLEISSHSDILTLQAAFSKDPFYVPPEEIIRIESQRERRGHFNIIHHDSGFKADIYLAGEDPFHIWALENIRFVPMLGVNVPVAPPEYVIIRKLQYFKEGKSDKHLRDIKSILINKNIVLDQNELTRWAQLLWVEKELENIQGQK